LQQEKQTVKRILSAQRQREKILSQQFNAIMGKKKLGRFKSAINRKQRGKNSFRDAGTMVLLICHKI